MPDSQLFEWTPHIHLLNGLQLTQRRSRPIVCEDSTVMRNLTPACYSLLDVSEDTDSFEKAGQRFEFDTKEGCYWQLLPLNRTLALKKMDELIKIYWFDQASQEISLSFGLHNAVGHFTSAVRVSFHLSPFGVLDKDIDLSYARLRPYSDDTNLYMFRWQTGWVRLGGEVFMHLLLLVQLGLFRAHDLGEANAKSPFELCAYFVERSVYCEPGSFGDHFVALGAFREGCTRV
eukprot:gnl/TRDRNA2_/TRDRNA2_166973_c10_seq1.p2 gnl/TRDRNA2_/TRDRNA2_166973_c10~~gnl/TRDRNA2_/TRDRNA2_166973_c10_seq1.p2  ORF type:complete len:245 (-),score=18.55 gnl/TRDRNA2_/TRDRNA2_166973_c10_seq1:628-1323(-)